MEIAIFTFNPFQENTYILYDDSYECIIVDPGCSNDSEKDQLRTFIQSKNLKPINLVNTHCHIDHVLGNDFVSKTYNLPLTSHKGEEQNLQSQAMVANMYGLPYTPSPPITQFLEEGDILAFGKTNLEIIFAPGHSPAHICLFEKNTRILIAGDVLFFESIGRTDLPGGNHESLIHNIKSKLFKLPVDTRVYPGHGPLTSIGHEINHNPFCQ